MGGTILPMSHHVTPTGEVVTDIFRCSESGRLGFYHNVHSFLCFKNNLISANAFKILNTMGGEDNRLEDIFQIAIVAFDAILR